jgi:chromate transporter
MLRNRKIPSNTGRISVVLTIPEPESVEVEPLLHDRRSTSTIPPSLWRLLWIWLGIGAQSFGGGSATLYLIRRVTVERHGWLSDEEFTRFWAFCQIAPGINLLCLTVLIGWRIAGAAGVALCLLGLLLPSVTITVLLAAFYAGLRVLPAVQAALRGVIPATIGLGLLMSLRMARPPLAASRREGHTSLLVSCTLLAGSAILFALLHPPVVAMLWAGGAAGAGAAWLRVRNRAGKAQ